MEHQRENIEIMNLGKNKEQKNEISIRNLGAEGTMESEGTVENIWTEVPGQKSRLNRKIENKDN